MSVAVHSGENLGKVDYYTLLYLLFFINHLFTLTNNVIFQFFNCSLRGLYSILNKRAVTPGLGKAVLQRLVPSWVLPTPVCICNLFQSSLLSAVLGELPASQGLVSVHGRIAYVSQQPWVFSGTVRSNILFGKKYEKERYEKVIKACALKKVSYDFWVASTQILNNNGSVGLNYKVCKKFHFSTWELFEYSDTFKLVFYVNTHAYTYIHCCLNLNGIMAFTEYFFFWFCFILWSFIHF